jgi:uncharacterized protein YjhX (UPF0386 family)
MIIRQVDMNTERSTLITLYNLKCRTLVVQAVESAAKGGLTREQQNKIMAIKSLNKDGYSLWRNAVTVSKNYYKMTTSETGVNGGRAYRSLKKVVHVMLDQTAVVTVSFQFLSQGNVAMTLPTTMVIL